MLKHDVFVVANLDNLSHGQINLYTDALLDIY